MLLDALLHPSSVVWNGPPRAVASLQATSQPTVSVVAVGVSDGVERRIDAVVHSPDRREWHVPFFVDERTFAVSKLWVYERPGVFDPELGLVMVVNGASGVRKSALLEALLEEATTPVDRVRRTARRPRTHRVPNLARCSSVPRPCRDSSR